MTVKSFITIEVEKNKNIYTFQMPLGSPFGEAYDAAFQVLKDIIELSKQAVDNVKQKSSQEDVCQD